MCYGEDGQPTSLGELRNREKQRKFEEAEAQRIKPDPRNHPWVGAAMRAAEARKQREEALAASVGPPVFQLNQNLPTKKSPQKAVLKIGRKSSVKTGSSKGRTGSTGSLRTPKTTINI